MKNLQNYLFKLCSEHLPSGFETRSDRIKEILESLVDECSVDAAGNVVGFRKAAIPGAKKLLLDAHLDEIGLIVTEIDESGFIHFTNLAGFSPVCLPASSVTVFGTRALAGVVATLPPHLQTKEESKKVTPIKDLVIDIGYSAEKARELVRVGDPILLRQNCAELMNNRVCGKALDNRVGVAVLLDVLTSIQKLPIPVDLYVVFSAGEEFNGFGARHAAWSIAPDEAIVVDVTHAESPGTPKEQSFPLGSGAAIGIAPILCGGMTDKLLNIAERCSIPYTKEVMSEKTGTNSDCITTSRSGVPTALVSVPLRYMHSGCEVVDLNDMKACSRLIGRYIHQGGVNRHE